MTFMTILVSVLLASLFADPTTGNPKKEKEPHGFAQSPDQVQALLQAASEGNADAQFQIANLYGLGQGEVQDEKQAAAWMLDAADQGHEGAKMLIDVTYGIEFARQAREARNTFRKLKALALNGDSDAQFKVGTAYYEAYGVPKDPSEAVAWYRKAAEKEHPSAMFNLGVCYSEGTGIPQNKKESASWFRKAALVGQPQAQVNLAFAYEKGEGVEQDPKLAAYWWTKAAENGEALAQYKLGSMYERGEVFEKDGFKAVKWFEMAAKQGMAQAQTALFLIFAQGTIVAKDNVLAYKWINLASGSGDKDTIAVRETLEKLMTPSEIEKAQEMCREFHSTQKR